MIVPWLSLLSSSTARSAPDAVVATRARADSACRAAPGRQQRGTRLGVIASLLMIGGAVLGGCATNPPTFGEKLQSQGDDIAEIGETWEDGKASVSEGRELILEGRKQVENGKQNIADGERMVRTGEQMVTDSERRYRDVSGGQSLPGS